MAKNSRSLIVLSAGILFLVSSARGAAEPKQRIPAEMKGFYGLIDGKVLSKTAQGLTLGVTAVKSWRESTAKAPQAVKGKRLYIAFHKQGAGPKVNPVQRYFILKRVRTRQNLSIAVTDNGDDSLSILALSRSQRGLKSGFGGFARGKPSPNPIVYYSEPEQTVVCGNGILRVRPSHYGIIWFDFYHPKEGKWYYQKNNLNLMTLVGRKWNNTEGDKIVPRVEVMSESRNEAQLRYHYTCPNGAKFYMDLSLRMGEPDARFSVHAKPDTKEIAGFQWHITNGQSEAVARLEFDKHKLLARSFPLPLPGTRLKVQKMQRFRNLKDLVFKFSGDETPRPDPNNPFWMGRVLGLKQMVTWGKPMRAKDDFAFEARDQPWQPHWKVPRTIPWFEGLHFVRKPFLEADSLTYRIDNYRDIARKRKK